MESWELYKFNFKYLSSYPKSLSISNPVCYPILTKLLAAVLRAFISLIRAYILSKIACYSKVKFKNNWSIFSNFSLFLRQYGSLYGTEVIISKACFLMYYAI